MSEIIINIFPRIKICDPDIVSAVVWEGESLVRKNIGNFVVTDEEIVFTPLFKFWSRHTKKLEDEIAEKVEKYIQSREN